MFDKLISIAIFVLVVDFIARYANRKRNKNSGH